MSLSALSLGEESSNQRQAKTVALARGEGRGEVSQLVAEALSSSPWPLLQTKMYL